MLDEIGQAVDHAGDQNLIAGKRSCGEAAEFVGVPRIGEWQNQAAHIGGEQRRQNVVQRHVAIVRRFGIAPAHMQAHAVARHVDECPVDRGDDLFDKINERRNGPVLVGDVAFECEIGSVDLQQQTVIHDRFVFDL